ncbi:MAG: primosomal protein N' [Planctomycetes bacterium]|nr:primosomal protein N' [Planctomycetota bacterium]
MAKRNVTKNLFELTEPIEEVVGGHVVRVVFDSAVDRGFDYVVGDELWPVEEGQRVEVPFGRSNKIVVGFCVGIGSRDEKRKFRLKKVRKLVDKEPLLDAELLELGRWISEYYVCPLGQVLSAMVPAAVKKGAGVKKKRLAYLAKDYKELIEGIRKGTKQEKIVSYLESSAAFDAKSAVGIEGLLEEVGCTGGPLKKLAEKLILKVTIREVLKSLPAIPEGLAVKAKEVVLNDDQEKVLGHINGEIDSGKFGVTVLYGVTDSGKTEVYIRAIERVLVKGKSAIVLLPEIALTTQTVQRFSSRFERIAVMHSGLNGAQRNAEWQKVKRGEADVVIGARSAVFAPLGNLGLVVVDEEHEPSYKQDTAPRYNGRNVAIKRGHLAGAHCILGSATPSLETLSNCKSKKHFTMVRLTKRVMDFASPEMRLVDMKNEVSGKGVTLISKALEEHLRGVLGRGEQAILFLNRRGYSNFVYCASCGHSLQCRNCDVTLTFHKKGGYKRGGIETVVGKHMHSGFAICHHCSCKTLVPQKCPLCGKGMAMIGLGSQRLEEELEEKFGDARVARVDSDSMQKEDYYRLLKDFGDGRIDILAGTQILAKGLHFPNVTLVGVISGDTCLYLPDFRSNERTYQLICQVAGRAGRSEKGGVVYVQSFLSNQPAIQFAVAGDFDGFVEEELKHRKSCNLPPYWRLASIVMRDMNFERLEAACAAMRERIDGIVASEGLGVLVRGPVPAVISRIQRFHRMQIIVQAPNAVSMGRLFSRLRVMADIKPAVKVAIDIDPVNLL